MLPVVYASDLGTDGNLNPAKFLDFAWTDSIRQQEIPEVQIASDTVIGVFASFTIHVCKGESCAVSTFSVVNERFVAIQLGATSFGWVKRSIYTAKNENCSKPRPTGMHFNDIQGTK